MGALLDHFRAAGIEFKTLPSGRLHAIGLLDNPTRDAIRLHKVDILAELSANDADHPAPATPDQAAELRALVAVFLADDTEAERAAAITRALADPDAALISFRLLAAEYRDKYAHARARGALEVATDTRTRDADDDRRTCTDCANLSKQDHRCLAAWRGERIGTAGRNYHPVVDVPSRCASYSPKASEDDHRPGAERWPEMVQDNQRLRDMASPQTYQQSNRPRSREDQS